MTIKLIHGFLHEEQKVTPQWGYMNVAETVLVETDSPNLSPLAVVAALPSGAGTVTSTNPKGIAFTFDVSTHPESSAFVLRTAGTIEQEPGGGCFWRIPLVYSNQNFQQLIGAAGASSSGGGGGHSTNPRQRKDQREVLSPLAKPYVWSKSTSIVQKETYTIASSSDPIVHTNGLPITQPFKYEEVHESHTFSYNVEYSSYSDSFYSPFIGKVNSTTCLGKETGTLKLSQFSAAEEYESVGHGVSKTDYHYVRVTMTFEWNPSGWDNDAKLVSMSTLQLLLQPAVGLIPAYYYYDHIKISETAYAKEPWPLLANGAAVPFDDNDPADYGYVNHGYPLTADLTTVTDVKSLVIP